MSVSYMTHPLIKHKSTLIRKETTGTNEFRKIIEEIAMLMGYEALATCTGRDEPLYETGRVEIKGDDLVLTAEETVVLSEMYDLEALFAEGKDAGVFEAYETLDALLAANGS